MRRSLNPHSHVETSPVNKIVTVLTLISILLVSGMILNASAKPKPNTPPGNENSNKLPQHFVDFLNRITIRVYLQDGSTFNRTWDFKSDYCNLFNYETYDDGKEMALIGMDDLPEGVEPDGCADIIFPIYYAIGADNLGGITDKYLFYVDGFMCGQLEKDFIFQQDNREVILYSYRGPSAGITVPHSDDRLSIMYVEYCPELDEFYVPVHASS